MNLNDTRRGGLLAGLLFAATGAWAQVLVNTAMTPEQLVQDVLLGSGVTVSNVQYNGVLSPATAQVGSGSFTNSGGNLGLPAGIILSTGLAGDAAGPASDFASTGNGTGSDPDLVAISNGAINDRAVLEFDFVPVGDSIKFRYVFGSDEYPEYVCSFNDAFGFFLSGPGFSGPYSNGAVNIALVPNSTTPVTIDNVNNGLNNNGDPDDPTCPPVNPEYYVDNESGTTIAYDGFTVVMEAVAQVQCGQTYHIKLAVGDAGGPSGLDEILDSGVFLEAGSFTSAPFVPTLTPGPGIVGNVMFESCFSMGLSFIRLGDASEAATFDVLYTGDFTNGVDIVPALPTVVQFAAGETAVPIVFNAPVDGDVLESLIMTVESFSECTGEIIENVFTFVIGEAPPLELEAEEFFVDCGGEVEISAGASGGFGAYVYDWGGGNTDATLVVAPLSDTSYPVTVTDNCGLTVSGSVPVSVTPTTNPFYVYLEEGPTVDFETVSESCFEVNVVFERFGGTAFEDTVYISSGGAALIDEDFIGMPTQVIFPVGVSTVSVPVTFPIDADGFEQMILTLGDVSICNGGFSELDYQFSINDAPDLTVVGGSPTIACLGSTVLSPAASGGYAPYSYEWTGGTVAATLTVDPIVATTYTAIVTDACNTSMQAVFNVSLTPPAPINMSVMGSPITTEACQPGSINIIRPNGVPGELVLDMAYAGTATNGADYVWPATRTIPTGLLNTIVPFEPLEDGVADDGETVTITASYTDACARTVTASVNLTINDAPAIVLGTTDITLECSEDSLPVSVDASGGFGGLDLLWSTGDVGSITYVPMQVGGTYSVTATDACGRTATAQSVVNIDCEIIVPNVFTPNGDGQNDRFFIEGIVSTENTVKVFNRWGQVVFEAKNYRNTWNATDVPDGTYFYEVLTARATEALTGHVTILRKY
ncbi:MAG: gliding motility-associated C-terminal domain-containing protein [Flavobacteriales bacterium]|nr:gliding motility-associated C-terminal domain-containing protein [Flavobacteriales bacterium]